MGNLFGRLLKREAGPQGVRQEQQHSDELRHEARVPSEVGVRIEWFDENGVCHSEPATVLETSGHGLAFTVDEEFSVDQTVWVENEGDMTKTVVRHIEPTARGFRAGAYRVEQERRRSDRQPVAGDAKIHWGDPQVGPCDAPVQVRNATEFGLQLECTFPLPVGTIVQVIGDELQCDGSTCYCRETGDKFIIGLHLVRQAYRRNSLDYKGD